MVSWQHFTRTNSQQWPTVKSDSLIDVVTNLSGSKRQLLARFRLVLGTRVYPGRPLPPNIQQQQSLLQLPEFPLACPHSAVHRRRVSGPSGGPCPRGPPPTSAPGP